MLDTNPPDHTRLRSLVSKAFTPRRIAELEPAITKLATEAMDNLADAGGGDLVASIAFGVPFAVISEMLGMPDGDVEELRRLSGLIVLGMEPVLSEADQARWLGANEAFDALVAEAITWKRDHLADDLLSGLIEVKDDSDRLSQEELVNQVGLLYIAGHETTVNLISGGVFALLSNPEQADLLRGDPALDANAVEELLRWDSPVHMTSRLLPDGLPLSAGDVPPGGSVIAGIAAANRDPRRFGPDADTLRIDRAEAAQHLTFSAGIHHCLGSSLARLEGRLVVPPMIRRFPEMAIAGPVPFNGRINLRGPASLPVTV